MYLLFYKCRIMIMALQILVDIMNILQSKEYLFLIFTDMSHPLFIRIFNS